MTAPGICRGFTEFLGRLAGADERAGEHDVRQQLGAFQELGRFACLLASFFHQFAGAIAAGIQVFGLAVTQEDEVHFLGKS